MAAKLLNSERLVSIGEMASRITHEIRNPLSTIKMNSEYMREHAHEMSAEEIESTFQPVIKEIVRLEQITDKYINMVKYRSTVEVASAVIPDDLAELVAFHRPEMEARDIEIDVVFPDAPLSLSIPVDAFREVLLNIMKNGWEEIEQSGRMRIRVAMISDTMLEIHIEDSGGGIADDMKEKIFETFFTGKAGGTGIGLSHSKTLVTENSGNISVAKSELGGADFVISMPYEKIV
jgi:signal transduction histidine kinase